MFRYARACRFEIAPVPIIPTLNVVFSPGTDLCVPNPAHLTLFDIRTVDAAVCPSHVPMSSDETV